MASPARRIARRWFQGAIAAGTVAAAFAIGWQSHAIRSSSALDLTAPGHGGNLVARAAEHPSPPPVTTKFTDASSPPSYPPSSLPEVELPVSPARLVRTVARLRIGNEDASAEVPILAGPGITEEWLKAQPPPVTEQGQVVFQRHGYHVDQRRHLISTVTPDGQRVSVPIDQVLIRYTGNQSL
jgi:hypothetical protein